jgi:hypothetical protein
LADGSFINVNATRMEISENTMLVWDGEFLVAYINTNWIASAHMSDRREEKNGRG